MTALSRYPNAFLIAFTVAVLGLPEMYSAITGLSSAVTLDTVTVCVYGADVLHFDADSVTVFTALMVPHVICQPSYLSVYLFFKFGIVLFYRLKSGRCFVHHFIRGINIVRIKYISDFVVDRHIIQAEYPRLSCWSDCIFSCRRKHRSGSWFLRPCFPPVPQCPVPIRNPR